MLNFFTLRYVSDLSRNTSTELGQDRFNAGEFAKIDQRRIELVAVSQTGVFIGPTLEHFVDVGMCGNETVRPEWDAALS
jgi:hypothetical protein